MELHRNDRVEGMRYPQENPPTSGIVRHDSHFCLLVFVLGADSLIAPPTMFVSDPGPPHEIEMLNVESFKHDSNWLQMLTQLIEDYQNVEGKDEYKVLLEWINEREDLRQSPSRQARMSILGTAEGCLTMTQPVPLQASPQGRSTTLPVKQGG
ncbi:hypothetical protein PR048_013944 [Dryococelus australis]|uniref:Uncharacterized protein n=1 Tax=Dryococelus australis TaxID=614101 RepID=A0ABQ9HTR7_9NEOP|nr:hypothetical protein PR048_013944 [Dryococelus australis]